MREERLILAVALVKIMTEEQREFFEHSSKTSLDLYEATYAKTLEVFPEDFRKATDIAVKVSNDFVDSLKEEAIKKGLFTEELFEAFETAYYIYNE